MSLNRLALRLAAVEALAPTDAAEFPTLAGDQVFDLGADIAGLEGGAEERIWIDVYTEDHQREPAGNARDLTGGQDEEVMLALECCIAPGAPAGANAFQLMARTMARLDHFEAQATRALEVNRRSGGLLAHVVIHFRKMQSSATVDTDLGRPIAVRRVELTCRVRVTGEPNFTATGLARLPSPLREVAMRLPVGSYGGAFAAEIAADLFADPAPVPLETLGLEARLQGQAETEIPAATAEINLQG